MRAGALCPRAPNLTCRWPRPAWSTMESTSSTGRPSRNSSRSTRAVATGNARPPLSAVSPAAQRMSHLIVICPLTNSPACARLQEADGPVRPLTRICGLLMLPSIRACSYGVPSSGSIRRPPDAPAVRLRVSPCLQPNHSRCACAATSSTLLLVTFGRTRHRSSPRMDRKFRLSDACQSCARRRQHCLSKQSRSACAEVHFERLLHRMHYVPLHQLQHGNMPPRLPAAFGACRLRRRKPCATGLQFYFCYKEYFSTSKVASDKLQ